MIKKLLKTFLNFVGVKEAKLELSTPTTPLVIGLKEGVARGSLFMEIPNNSKYKCECNTAKNTPCRRLAVYMYKGRDYCLDHAKMLALEIVIKGEDNVGRNNSIQSKEERGENKESIC